MAEKKQVNLVMLTLRIDGEEITYGLQIDNPPLDDALEMQVRGPLIRKWLDLVRKHSGVITA